MELPTLSEPETSQNAHSGMRKGIRSARHKRVVSGSTYPDVEDRSLEPTQSYVVAIKTLEDSL
jgi:hypothetical protein